ncbi:MAG: hypothetical protein ACKO2C_07370 [Actinomycetes bacterium]
MSRRSRLAVPVLLGAIGAALVALLDPQGPWLVLVLLGAAIALGELLQLRPSGRVALPLSYAFFLVAVRAGTPTEVIVTVVLALVLGALLSTEPDPWTRIYTLAVRIGAFIAALSVYRFAIDHLAAGDPRWNTLMALLLSGAAAILASDLLTAIRHPGTPLGWRGRTADLAIVTTGALMAISYDGIAGHPGMGMWGPVLFAIPLLAAWFAFEQVAAIRRTHDQTIAALSVVPELAGLVRAGHAMRVADLAERLARELGFEDDRVVPLRSASLLHHLGHLCLDVDETHPQAIEPWEVATKGAEILRQTEELTPAAAILDGSDGSMAGHILRVASAFDELCEGDHTKRDAAIEALHLGPGYVYDVRVLAALERV